MRQLNLALWDTPRKDIYDTIQKIWYNGNSISYVVVGLAQMVRASDCGPEGRRFNSDIPPQEIPQVTCECSTAASMQVFQTWDESSILSTRTKYWLF